VADLGQGELLARPAHRGLDLAGDRLDLAELPLGGDVADQVDPQADGVAGDHPQLRS
jgi:hypothetical protein